MRIDVTIKQTMYVSISSNYDAKESSLRLGVMNMDRYFVNGNSKERLDIMTKLALHEAKTKIIATWKSCK